MAAPAELNSQFHDEDVLVFSLEHLVQLHDAGTAAAVAQRGHLVHDLRQSQHAHPQLVAELGGEPCAGAAQLALEHAGPLAPGTQTDGGQG